MESLIKKLGIYTVVQVVGWDAIAAKRGYKSLVSRLGSRLRHRNANSMWRSKNGPQCDLMKVSTLRALGKIQLSISRAFSTAEIGLAKGFFCFSDASSLIKLAFEYCGRHDYFFSKRMHGGNVFLDSDTGFHDAVRHDAGFQRHFCSWIIYFPGEVPFCRRPGTDAKYE
jgi:hypothetical protein